MSSEGDWRWDNFKHHFYQSGVSSIIFGSLFNTELIGSWSSDAVISGVIGGGITGAGTAYFDNVYIRENVRDVINGIGKKIPEILRSPSWNFR